MSPGITVFAILLCLPPVFSHLDQLPLTPGSTVGRQATLSEEVFDEQGDVSPPSSPGSLVAGSKEVLDEQGDVSGLPRGPAGRRSAGCKEMLDEQVGIRGPPWGP